MDKIRILHTADLHLGNPFTDSGFDEERIHARRTDLLNCFHRMIDSAVERDIQLIIVSGDLFEEDRVRQADIYTFCDKFAGVSPMQIVLLPGNHDYYRAGGYYDWIDWPENVHIFRSRNFKKIDFPQLDLSLFGSAFTAPEDPKKVLDDFHPTESLKRRVLVHHGSLVHKADEKSAYRPFDEKSIQRLDVDYIALGHYHKPSIIKDTKGTIIASYPGSPEPLNFGEMHHHSFNIVTLDGGKVEIELVPSNKRNYLQIDVNCSGMRTEMDVTDKCMELISHKASPEDIVRFDLTGMLESGLKFDTEIIRERLKKELFWIRIADRTVPDYDIDVIEKEETTRGYFTKRMNELIKKAVKNEENEKAERLKDALFYGLTALEGKKPEKR